MSADNSPLTEASTTSLDEYFSRKPPYDAETLSRIKAEFRRMREIWLKAESGEGPKPKVKRTPKAPVSRVIADDLFDPEATP